MLLEPTGPPTPDEWRGAVQQAPNHAMIRQVIKANDTTSRPYVMTSYWDLGDAVRSGSRAMLEYSLA